MTTTSPVAAPDWLVVTLLSDTTFGRGEGAAGEVDVEIEHDALGLPMLGGKSLHGLLRDTWLSMSPAFPGLRTAAARLLGPEGDLAETAILRVGDALVDGETRGWVDAALHRDRHKLTPDDMLHALTDIRYQTAEARSTGAPATTTLRMTRVATRGLSLSAPLTWLASPGLRDLTCLALLALATRHGGLSRNRGRGHVQLALNGDLELTKQLAVAQ